MTLDPLSLALGFLAGAIIAALLALVLNRNAHSAFRAVSADALNANNQAFLDLAGQHLGKLQEAAKGDLDQRSQTIAMTVAPVAKTLETLNDKLQQFEKERAESHGDIRQRLAAMGETQQMLKSETGRLVQAMRTPMGRGSWGEMQLYRLLEQVGMIEGVDYHRQLTVVGEDARYRPDVVVKLPGDKTIVIDAKAPLEAYFTAIEATDDDLRALSLKAHAGQVREQMKKLAEKEYWKQFDHSPEFVVMFLPSEGACATALQYDLDMIEAGMKHNVVIATPLTLFALLRTIAYGWRQERIADNAVAIAQLGRELYERVSKLAENYGRLGDSLKKSVETYNTTLGQIETRVLVTARKLKEKHDVAATGEIAALAGLEVVPKILSAPEMLANKAANGDD